MPFNIGETIKIAFISSDFKDNSYSSNEDCPLARAIKRELKLGNICVLPEEVLFKDECYKIVGGFGNMDYQYIRERMLKNNKERIYITLKHSNQPSDHAKRILLRMEF